MTDIHEPSIRTGESVSGKVLVDAFSLRLIMQQAANSPLKNCTYFQYSLAMSHLVEALHPTSSGEKS